MKNVLVIICVIFIYNYTFGQKVKFEPIHVNQSFQLNSGSRAMFGGQSRAYLAVDVPNGAKAIVYTVRSIMDYDPSNDIKLAASLTTLCTGNFAIAKTINALPVPNSNAVIDVYTIPTEDNNLNNFLSKQDDKWKFFTDQSCLSSLGCKRAIDVSDGTKKIYICLRNPSATKRIIAVVDVVAVMPD